MRRVRLAGQLAEPISHYSDAVRVGGWLWISGMLPVDAAGALVGAGDVAAQAEQVLANVGAVLAAAGASFGDVVRVGVFLTRIADGAGVFEVRRRFFGPSRPASTLVEVSALVLPGALVEVEAVAAVPEER